MSYVEKSSEDENENKQEEIKLKNPFKTMLSKDTIIESPEDIIAKDPDSERKQLFKKTYDALLLMYPPEEDITKKKKKAKEKEKLIQRSQEIQQNKDNKEIEPESKEDKGRER